MVFFLHKNARLSLLIRLIRVQCGTSHENEQICSFKDRGLFTCKQSHNLAESVHRAHGLQIKLKHKQLVRVQSLLQFPQLWIFEKPLQESLALLEPRFVSKQSADSKMGPRHQIGAIERRQLRVRAARGPSENFVSLMWATIRFALNALNKRKPALALRRLPIASVILRAPHLASETWAAPYRFMQRFHKVLVTTSKSLSPKIARKDYKYGLPHQDGCNFTALKSRQPLEEYKSLKANKTMNAKTVEKKHHTNQIDYSWSASSSSVLKSLVKRIAL